jgi:hypothetical protein
MRYLSLMSCGGVNMDVRPRRLASSPSHTRSTHRVTLGKSVMVSRKSSASLYWDVSLPD